jgi:hypothetical protein
MKRSSAKSKYHNVRTNGFASKKEAKRFQELKLLEKAGEIRDLRTQTILPIVINGKKVCDYICDFSYWEGSAIIFEDAKGMKTPVYRLKKKLVKAIHDIDILET